jgi:prepilin-type N-terminal cleavage/methylation domain-containing protein
MDCGVTTGGWLRNTVVFRKVEARVPGMGLAVQPGVVVKRRARSRGGSRVPGPGGRRAAGFTIIELMVVLVVIAVVAGLAAPAISKAMHERRTAEAALDLVRLARHARSSAAGFGRAHMLRFLPNDPGRVLVLRGRNNRCNGNVWAPNDWNANAAAPCEQNDFCIDELDMYRRFHTSSNDVALTSAMGAVDVCYEPTGVVRWRLGGAGMFLEANSIGGGIRFDVVPRVGGNENGVVRRVVIPLGGDARVVR